MPPRTYEIQSAYQLQAVTGSDVVGWAVDALTAGFDSLSLRMLAGLERPLDDNEVRRLYAASFRELGIESLQGDACWRFHTRSTLGSMLRGNLTRKAAMKHLSELCVRLGYPRELMDFYLLFYAMWDLEAQEMSGHWKGANRSNIADIVDDRSRAWLEAHRGGESGW